MKKLLLYIILLTGSAAQSQTLFPNLAPNVSSTTNYLKYGYLEAGTFIFTVRDTFPALLPSLIKHPNGKYYHTAGDGAPWFEFQSGSGGGSFSFNGRTSPITPQLSDYSGFYSPLSHTHTWSSLTSKPTTLSAAGITDGVTTAQLSAAGYLTNITGKITEGSNVTITGTGTTGSPYIINSIGSGSSTTLYSTTGGNTDGAMTQAAATTAIGTKVGFSDSTRYSTKANSTKQRDSLQTNVASEATTRSVADAGLSNSVNLRKFAADSVHNRSDNYVRQDRMKNFYDSSFASHPLAVGNMAGPGDTLFTLTNDTLRAKTLQITGTDITKSVSATTLTFTLTGIKTGLASLSGNGSSTTLDIGLPSTPTWIGYPAPANAASVGVTYIEAIGNGIRVHWSTAPASGSNNISLYYSYK